MSESKKKIIILGSAYPLRGGLANYNERLAKEYADLGCDVVIYTFKLQYPKILFPGKTQYSSLEKPKGLNIEVKVNSINPFNWFKVGRKIRKLNVDLLIVKFWIPFMAPCLGTICRRVKKNKKTKIVSIIDNIIPHEKRIGDKLFAKYFVKSVHGFVTMSKLVLKELEIFDTKKPKIYNPHPLYDNFGDIMEKNQAKKELGLTAEINYLLFFGFIRDYKGLDILIDVMADSRIKKLNVNLVVAGEFYSDSEKYIELIKKYNLKNIILKTDFIPDNEVAKYFSAADMIVQPYKSATQSGVTQIAYHFNKPMLVTNVGGLAEIVPHGKVGYVVDVNSNAVTEAILDFYKEKREKEMIIEAEKEKEKYTWNTLIEAIKKVS